MLNPGVKVLIVDGSIEGRARLAEILSSDRRMVVAGQARDGQTAIRFIQSTPPDVVLVDVDSPDSDGYGTTRTIMETNPLPIVICESSPKIGESVSAFRALEAGAVACVESPIGRAKPEFEKLASELCQMLRLMSEVRVVRRWSRDRHAPAAPRAQAAESTQNRSRIEVIGIGASTGGPPVLQTILSGLQKEISASILIVQHISPGFLKGLADWLDQTTEFPVHIAENNSRPLPGHVYLAPDDYQMGLTSNGLITLTKDGVENSMRPAVSFLFRSLAGVLGPRATGVLLTGMGKDGAAELKLMRDVGAITFAQDSCANGSQAHTQLPYLMKHKSKTFQFEAISTNVETINNPTDGTSKTRVFGPPGKPTLRPSEHANQAHSS